MNYYSTPPRSDELWHFGIKGMKWGVRRYQNEDGTLTSAGKKRYDSYENANSKGNPVKIFQTKKNKFGEVSFDAFNDNGKKVSSMIVERRGNDLYLNWVSTKKKHKNKGYAQALMNKAIKYAKQSGAKHMNLEVPHDDPDAMHIYTKNGFRRIRSDDNFVYMKRDV